MKWLMDHPGWVIGTIGAVFVLVIGVAFLKSDRRSLEEKANTACGQDTPKAFDLSTGGRNRIAVTCERPDGSFYVKVVRA